jgi:hypothetical protein
MCATRDDGGSREKRACEIHAIDRGRRLSARAPGDTRIASMTSTRARRHGGPFAAASLASAAGIALLLFAPDARAWCRGLTEAGPDPASTHACFAGGDGIYELFWRNQCVGYSLQSGASSQVSLAQATQVAAQAFAAWSAASCDGASGSPSVQAFDEGPVDCGVVQYRHDGPNQHVIVFRDDAWPHDDPNNALALTTVTYDASTGEIVDADMEINSHDFTIVAGAPATPPAYDLLSILTHEAGHFLGLAHSANEGAVMYTFYRPGTTALTDDDASGICSIYAPDGTRSTSAGTVAAGACDPTPRHGFASTCDAPPQNDGDAGAGAEGGASGGGGPGAGGCTIAGATAPATPEPAFPLAVAGLAALALSASASRRRSPS